MRSYRARYVCLLVVAALVLGLAGCAPTAAVNPTQSGVRETPAGQAATVAEVITKVVTKVIIAAPTPVPTPTPMAAPLTPGRLEIHVLNVSHGDAQLIISPTGETMLIDVGRKELSARTAEYLRQVLGELAVDYLMLSHYHVDHIEAFIPLIEAGLKIRRAIFDRGGDRNEYDSDHYRGFYDYVADPANGLKRIRVYPGDKIDMGPDITLEVLAVGDIDSRTAVGVPVVGENDNSIALWLTFGDFDYWTAGDMSGVDNKIKSCANIESAVIPLLPREVDVYRVNHHAIEYNSNPEFLSALNPTASIASTSNSVVDWVTVNRLKEQGDLYLTIPAHEAGGDVVLTSRDGMNYTVQGNVYTSK